MLRAEAARRPKLPVEDGSVRYSTGKQPDGFSRSSQQLRYLRARVVPRRDDLRPPPAQATPPAACRAGGGRFPEVGAGGYCGVVRSARASFFCLPAGRFLFIHLLWYNTLAAWHTYASQLQMGSVSPLLRPLCTLSVSVAQDDVYYLFGLDWGPSIKSIRWEGFLARV